MNVGIQAINLYGGQTFLRVRNLFQARGLDLNRFDNLMIEKKAVSLSCEDAVTNGVNAALPIVEAMSPRERDRIEMVITSTESGFDFGKSLSTYIHQCLNLKRNCRLFEVKQACYGGTAAFQMGINYLASGVSPGARVLVVATDEARGGGKNTFHEPSQGMGAVAMLLSDEPQVFEVDFGANGLYSYEVMDTCRPQPNIEAGDPDLSLLSYLDCLENSYNDYARKVEGIDFCETFDHLVFHTPFAGMVKGAHRKMMRLLKGRLPADVINEDFDRRMGPSLKYCVQIGNVYSATVYLALTSLIDNAKIDRPKRVGLFSYGSGCSSEFFSGTVTEASQKTLASMKMKERLEDRYELSMEEYDQLLENWGEGSFGIKELKVDHSPYGHIYRKQMAHRGLLALKEVKGYHREYVRT